MPKPTLPLHRDALPTGVYALLPKLKQLAPQGVLGGGTALAFQLGHRRSFDLDIFVAGQVKKKTLLTARKIFGKAVSLIDTPDELTLRVGETKISVIYFPFPPLHKTVSTDFIPLFDIRDLAANKIYAIGRRGTWRDYVDVWQILQNGFALKNIISEAQKRFGSAFSEKLFLEQLTYYGDIHDFTIEWLGKKITKTQIQKDLEKAVNDYCQTYGKTPCN